MNQANKQKIHIIGIEGGGTSALACFYKGLGHEVSGSDQGDHFFNEFLTDRGIKVFDRFSPNNLPADADLIVYSSAYSPESNIELRAALTSNRPVLSYAQALAQIFNKKYGIAVIGSHGKTTVTAWLAFVMQRARLQPSAIIGAKVPQLKGSSLVGESDYMLIEADEYQNKLQYYQPQMVILNNIDYDHPDFFSSPEDYYQVFADFIKKIPEDGCLIANFDDPRVKKLAADCPARVISYSLIKQEVDYQVQEIDYQDERTNFIIKGQKNLGRFTIKLLGQHNVSNAAAVIVASRYLNVTVDSLKQYMLNFLGTVRRLQMLGERQGAVIWDDFGHHPTEIKATLSALRQRYPKEHLTVIFSPHTFSRTKVLLDDFAQAFDRADELIVLPIYGSVREEQGTITSQELIDKIKTFGKVKQVSEQPGLTEATDYLRQNLKAGDVILLLGAGDVFKIGQELLSSK